RISEHKEVILSGRTVLGLDLHLWLVIFLALVSVSASSLRFRSRASADSRSRFIRSERCDYILVLHRLLRMVCIRAWPYFVPPSGCVLPSAAVCCITLRDRSEDAGRSPVLRSRLVGARMGSWIRRVVLRWRSSRFSCF